MILIVCFSCFSCCGSELVNEDSDDCSCMNSTTLLFPLLNCETVNGAKGIFAASVDISYCFPLDYGSNGCAAHDLWTDPRCWVEEKEQPKYCKEQWCYVDIDKCKRAKLESVQQSIFANQYPSLKHKLFWSYSICNASSDTFDEFATLQALNNKTLTVTIPGMWLPFHYKLTNNGSLVNEFDLGSDYYNDDVRWMGAAIDYLDAVMDISNVAGVRYTFRSVGGDAVFPLSNHDASTVDVQHGISDMALSAYWITPARLNRTAFTVPIFVDNLYLWIRQPEESDGTLVENALKVFKPFQTALWIVLIVMVLVFSTVYVWFIHAGKYDNALYLHFQGPKWDHGSFFQRSIGMGKALLESVLIFSSWVFGGAAEIHVEASLAQKLLVFGFSFLVFMVVATYTANLTAFLTLPSVLDYVTNMDEAIERNVRVCAAGILKHELESRYSDAKFVFAYGGPDKIIDDYQDGKCGAVLMSLMNVQYEDGYMDRVCTNHLVSTGSIAYQTHVAFPIQKSLAAGVSYWLMYAATKGITFERSVRKQQVSPLCNLELFSVITNDADDLTPLTVEHFVLPILFCIVCAVVAITVHLRSILSSSSSSRSLLSTRPHGFLLSNNDLYLDDHSDTKGINNGNNSHNNNNNENNNNNNNNNNNSSNNDNNNNPKEATITTTSNNNNDNPTAGCHHDHYHPLTQNLSDIRRLIQNLAEVQHQILQSRKSKE